MVVKDARSGEFLKFIPETFLFIIKNSCIVNRKESMV